MKRVLLAFALLAACGSPPANVPPATPSSPKAPAPGPAADPLGTKPVLAPAPSYVPPTPTVYRRADGVEVWLLERHTLPIVSIELVVSEGASSDAKGKEGVAFATATMLDEGAGSRGPLEISRDIDRLGATLQTGAFADYSFAQLTTLKKNVADAVAIFGDVVTKPTFSPVEWKRVHDLWREDLRQAISDPSAVTSVVVAARAFPQGHPYAHPISGTRASAEKVTLDDVKAFYARAWRADQAHLVVAGDITRAELDPLLDAAFAKWPRTARSERAARVASTDSVTERCAVVVDRPGAPQSVVAVARPGVSSSDAIAPLLSRANTVFGGSFTSRINQDLREEHGWSYGAKSRFGFTRDRGLFIAQAAVQTEHTGEALAAMRADLAKFAGEGLTDEEVDKSRLLVRSELVESFEGVAHAVHRLARNAGVGLPADHEAKASARLQAATKAELDAAAKVHFDPSSAVVVIVGPKSKIAPQLKGMCVVSSGPEGR